MATISSMTGLQKDYPFLRTRGACSAEMHCTVQRTNRTARVHSISRRDTCTSLRCVRVKWSALAHRSIYAVHRTAQHAPRFPFLSCSNVSCRRRSAGRTNSVPDPPTTQNPILKTQANNNNNPFLLKDLSKLAQSNFHQDDYDQVLRWWEQLEISVEQPQGFRNQPIKWFMWSMSALPDPQFSVERIELSKVIGLVYVIDDVFDLLGSLEELTLFTQAVERWDNSQLMLDSLPAYMKFCMHALYNTTNEIADLVMKNHGLNPVDSLRKTWTSLFKAFLLEAQWFRDESPPRAKEYLENGVTSTGVCVVLVHLNFLLGIEGNRKKGIAFQDDKEMPLLFFLAALILRLWDDLGSAGDENQDGFDGSYVDCYMKEHDISLQTARKHTNQMISNAWREFNKEILSENQISPAMKKATLNMISMLKVMYNYENQRLPILEE